jgi:hypothetical protein
LPGGSLQEKEIAVAALKKVLVISLIITVKLAPKYDFFLVLKSE